MHPYLVVGLLGIGLKFAVGTAPDPRDQQALLDTASVLLAQNGYHIEHASQTTEIAIAASNGDCRLVLAEIRPQGWNTAQIQTLYRDYDDIFYVLGGKILRQPPVYRATLHYQIARIMGQLRVDYDWQPVWAIIGQARCKPESLFATR
ncbi:hypothetical protein [Rhizobium sp. Leaf384]|uniref:hypothetical protein n=1 Tax=Rhizobium sp. Leaf384 TaxID=1736358 RepID=UPI0012E9307C|nr:hypothetical protein [Rhizobium sp. Leaf384]